MVEPLLEIAGLSKAFTAPGGERTNVIEVSHFSITPQEHVALQGASGSGKTTFLNLIAGILQADRGKIVVAGAEMTALSESGRDRLRASKIGYVFQNFNLLQGYTALENVLLGMVFGKGPDIAYARHLLESVGLESRLNYRPAQLSIGQQQRVAVARALANKPLLVLADEPIGNLDEFHAAEALTLIRDVCRKRGAALLLVSHDPQILNTFPRLEQFSSINRAAPHATHAAVSMAGNA